MINYYEKIKQDKQKNLIFDIIWQIGDMDDSGFVKCYEEAEKAEASKTQNTENNANAENLDTQNTEA